MRKNIFENLLQKNDFTTMFVQELAWNESNGQLPPIDIDGNIYSINVIAELSGFKILCCVVDSIPTNSESRRIDTKIQKFANDYLLVFVKKDKFHHRWLAPVKKVDKRDLVTIEYNKIDQTQPLYEKLNNLTFSYSSTPTIVDVKEKINKSFIVNSEEVTKNFYTEFKKQHGAFMEFISGIPSTPEGKKDRQWYASVMLNRLMFCYFIQKKGFLDGKVDYLSQKLNEIKKLQGENKFFKTFYQGFLKSLFHSGLNNPRHSADFEKIYGRIPYLNGGMFDEHQIEREYSGIDIKDEAFEKLFKFFDQWNWHLDTRIEKNGKDINPDVLGYIFEQYINQRAEMGAYYTKEDITEYIGRNTILPFLLEKVKVKDAHKDFEPDGFVWKTLKEGGDKYIFDAVKKGYREFKNIPPEVKRGIITPDMQEEYAKTPINKLPTNHIPLSELRSEWNKPTPETWALPTEIWRETIERLQRCEDIISNIEEGKINSINDLITYNLDIREFVIDLLKKGDHLFIRHFFEALQSVTILDPTCGSGAFLFAALNILEPLYELCIERMDEDKEYFKPQLAEIENNYRSNIQYFIYKSIILRNLYGVDIMPEAIEIAKLRLFLKMVAVVDVDLRADNLGLDPLPDIDFNIRCGNTLVGYANMKQLKEDLDFDKDTTVKIANERLRSTIYGELELVSKAYKRFKEIQLTHGNDKEEFSKAKSDLKKRLNDLNEQLNQRLYMASPKFDEKDGEDFSQSPAYHQWLSSHQPFNWIADFYQIIQGNGGFDVIIGNPPYVEYNKKNPQTRKSVSDYYQISGYETLNCGNLYAFVLERSKILINTIGFVGEIIPLSGHSTDRMESLVNKVYNSFKFHLFFNLSADANPQRLFDGVKFRLAIFIGSKNYLGYYTSKYSKWLANERPYLFSSIPNYVRYEGYKYKNIIPKISNNNVITILNKIKSEKQFFGNYIGNNKVFYHNCPVHWLRAHFEPPFFKNERDGEVNNLNSYSFERKDYSQLGMNIICSSLFFIWWITNSDCYHLNNPEMQSFGFNPNDKETSSHINLSIQLSNDMLSKSRRRVYNYRTTGKVEYDEFYMKLSKSIIDEIDLELAKHYGFSEEELDFIINYDIKYRMRDELNSEE